MDIMLFLVSPRLLVPELELWKYWEFKLKGIICQPQQSQLQYRFCCRGYDNIF
uniref:Glycosyl hydrolase family 17 protein n=1 Tax=Solanum tuberosum TaxID=4113 RepID=M1D1U6_SOLTU